MIRAKPDTIIASVEAPADGFIGDIDTSRLTVLTPCQPANQVAILRCVDTCADLATECCAAAIVDCSDSQHIAAGKLVQTSLVRVRRMVETEAVGAIISDDNCQYSIEFDASCLDAEVMFYWSCAVRPNWIINVTEYDLFKAPATLRKQLGKLEKFLKRTPEASSSYLVWCSMKRISITLKDKKNDKISKYSRGEFMAVLKPYENDIEAFLKGNWQENISSITISVTLQELIKTHHLAPDSEK